MKIESKSLFSKFSDTIDLLNPNKLTKEKEMNCEQKTSADPVGTYYKIMKALEDKMSAWERASVERAQAKISQVPTFHKAPIVQILDNAETIKQVIENGSARMKQNLIDDAIKYNVAYEEENTNWLRLHVQTTMRKELAAKAARYKINFVNWDTLDSQVEEWERLLSEAKELNLKVDPSDYDPYGLKSLIEEELSQGRKEMRDQYLDYCAGRL